MVCTQLNQIECYLKCMHNLKLFSGKLTDDKSVICPADTS